MSDVYHAPESDLSGAHATQRRYAGFWIRTLAAVIDTLWVLPLTAVLGFLFYGAQYFESQKIIQGAADVVIQYVMPVVVTLCFWIAKQATPGKMALGIKIVNVKDGLPPSKGRLLLRYVGYYVSMFALFLGFIWVGFDPKKQGFHDKMAGTVVIYSQ